MLAAAINAILAKHQSGTMFMITKPFTDICGIYPNFYLFYNQWLKRTEGDQKRGVPRYEGISKDVDENKGQFFWRCKSGTMFMKIKCLKFSSKDVYDNKRG